MPQTREIRLRAERKAGALSAALEKGTAPVREPGPLGGSFLVPFGAGTPLSKPRNRAKDSCPQAQCPEGQYPAWSSPSNLAPSCEISMGHFAGSVVAGVDTDTSGPRKLPEKYRLTTARAEGASARRTGARFVNDRTWTQELTQISFFAISGGQKSMPQMKDVAALQGFLTLVLTG
jgi:hypothetical protein